MFQRILVPLDGSRRAEVAVTAAARLAHASHGSVILMRTVSPIKRYEPYISMSREPAPVQVSQERDSAMRYLEEVAGGAALKGIPTSLRVIDGSAAEAILTVSQAERADLIAICAHGLTGYLRWKLGGVSQHVVRHASTPVLLLPDPAPGAEADPSIDALAHVRRVLVPLDGSMLAETALAPAIELLSALAPENGELHLTQIVSPFTAERLGIPAEDLAREIRDHLAGKVQRMEDTRTEQLRLSITSSAMLDTDAAARILALADPAQESPDAASQPGYDIIVMATHGRTGVMRWTLGSITERIIQSARMPLLVVRPKVAETPNA